MISGGLASLSEAGDQIGTSAEDTAVTSLNNALDSVVDIEKGVCGLKLHGHSICEGIVLARSVQSDDLDRCNIFARVLGIVLDLDLLEAEI